MPKIGALPPLKFIERVRSSEALTYRSCNFEFERAEGEGNENVFNVIASTDAPADFGYVREILLHGKSNVNIEPAVSVLFNHDRNQVIGGIRKVELDGHQMRAEIEIDPDAKGTNGNSIARAIKKKYLRGISIGYRYDETGAEVTEKDGVRTVTVKKWELREISVTPTQVDTGAVVVRNLPDSITKALKPDFSERKTIMPQFKEWLEKRGFNPETLSAEQSAALEKIYNDEKIRSLQGTESKPAAKADNAEAKSANERAEKAERELALVKTRSQIESMARSFGVELSQEDVAGIDSHERGIELVMERKAAAEQTRGVGSGYAVAEITEDASDKAAKAAEDALLAMVDVNGRQGIREEKDLGMRGGSFDDTAIRWSRARGFDLAKLNKVERARWILGKDRRMNQNVRGANVTSGQFSTYLLANVMDKAVARGYNNFKRATYPIWTTSRTVPDFKQFTGAALDVANLQETTENVAFPELTKDEGGYNATLGLWGGTLSLTFQALVNDDLGEFMRTLGRVGGLTRRTIEKQVYTILEANAFTNRISTTVPLATAGNIDAARTEMMAATGPGGEKLETVPSYLIVPSGLRETALQKTKQVQGATEFNANTDLLPIVTPHLTTAGTAANSDWYLAADPSEADTVVVATLNGMNAPVVEEYDSGATAKRCWKAMFAFVAKVPDTNVGMWKGDAV